MATILYLTCILLTYTAYAAGYVMSDGSTGKLPTLGWNSWNAYNCDINEDHFLDAAHAMIDAGLKDAGYNYVNSQSIRLVCSRKLTEAVDDCWMMKDGRDSSGHLVPNSTRFPNGINGLADKVHDMGFKFGIYECELSL